MGRGLNRQVKWSFKNILIGIGVVWFLIVGLLSAPWVLIRIKRGFLPWIYKDEWGKGGKLFAFRLVYVGAEMGILYALVGKHFNNWWYLLAIMFWALTYNKE